MSRRIIALAAAAMYLTVSVAAQVKTADYDPVLKLMDDREKFIEAVRTYDRAQGYLVKADQMIAEFYMKEGNQGMASAKLKKANERIKNVRELYEIALGRYTDSALLHNYYGELLYDRFGDIPGALLEWNKAISYDVDLSQAYNNIGLHEVHTGQYASGLRNLERALELESKNPDYLYNLAQIYLVHGPQVSALRALPLEKVYRQAMKMSKEAAELAPEDYELLEDYAVNFFAGENFGVEVDWKDAAAAWQTARESARTDEERFYTWLNEARSWIKIKRTPEAVACLEAAVALRPESEIAQQLLREQREVPDADADLSGVENSPAREPESAPETEPAPQVDPTPDSESEALPAAPVEGDAAATSNGQSASDAEDAAAQSSNEQ